MVRVATQFAIGGGPVSARVCTSLQEAAAQPYFFEALLGMAQRSIPHGDDYEAWRQERAMAMKEGREIYFLGRASK
jgi:1,4-dihydroxy-2-naphthoyl-CoA synthase